MRGENQTKKVYAQKPRLNMLFKNSISAAQELPGALRNFHEFKGTVSRDFLLLVFFLNQFPPSL
jgi:hypothetical protein